MYIEYITPQRVADTKFTEYHSKGGDFRPSYLIRTLDWEKVPGRQATDGYHTLSYCWEQSGEKVEQDDREFSLTDNGGHQITEQDGEQCVTYSVTYDALLQRVCKDFDIDYLWYDKICIDQTNKAKKHNEIKQMHLIYSNACYTVALVPEIYIDDPRDFKCKVWNTKVTRAKTRACKQMYGSLWWKRSWTLEEVMMSTRILIVGRNTHFWSLADIKQGSNRKENELIANYLLSFKEKKTKSASQVLRYASFRTSTKEHDKIFALANIFDDIINIDIDYDSDILVAMNKFYQHLALHDLSVMCFGANLNPWNRKPQYTTTMDTYNLPSWTGVNGLHVSRPISDVTVDHNYNYTVDDHMRLRIRCRSLTIRPRRSSYFYDVFTNGKRGKEANLNLLKHITSIDDFEGDEIAALDWSQMCLMRTTGCYANQFWETDTDAEFCSPILPLSLTEECEECVILGVIFNGIARVVTSNVRVSYIQYYVSPVVKKYPDTSEYKVIGIALLNHFQDSEHCISPQDIINKMLSDEANDFTIF